MSKIKNCVDCKNGPLLQEGCSRVVCPMRKPVTAQAIGTFHYVPSNSDMQQPTSAYVKTPTDKEDYDA